MENKGNSFLIKDNNEDRSYKILLDNISQGYKALCITRTHPMDIKRKYNIDSSFLWLTNKKSDSFNTTIDIEDIKKNIKKFITDNEKSTILLDRIDFLSSMHGFNNVLKMVYSLNDHAIGKDVSLMLNINPDTLEKRELSLLEQELKEIAKEKGSYELSDDLHEILFFLNNTGKATFKQISKEFMITKTTTRKRINTLIEKGYVDVKKNGRNKIVRITDNGQNII